MEIPNRISVIKLGFQSKMLSQNKSRHFESIVDNIELSHSLVAFVKAHQSVKEVKLSYLKKVNHNSTHQAINVEATDRAPFSRIPFQFGKMTEKASCCFLCLAKLDENEPFSGCYLHQFCLFCSIKYLEICLSSNFIPFECAEIDCPHDFNHADFSLLLKVKYKQRYVEIMKTEVKDKKMNGKICRENKINDHLGNTFLAKCYYCSHVSLYSYNKTRAIRCLNCNLLVCKSCLQIVKNKHFYDKCGEQNYYCHMSKKVGIKRKVVDIFAEGLIFSSASYILLMLCSFKKTYTGCEKIGVKSKKVRVALTVFSAPFWIVLFLFLLPFSFVLPFL